MGRMRREVLIAVALAAMVWFCPAEAADYEYGDDFSTDKAMTDSYEHSVFLTSLPSPWPVAGFLTYQRGAEYDNLAFYSGSGDGAQARLFYTFPLERFSDIESGTLEFDIVHIDGELGWLAYWRQYAGGGWEWVTTVSLVGHYTFDLDPGPQCSHVSMGLVGESGGDVLLLDNLSVALTYTTPMDGSTWSKLKSLYR